MIDYLGWFTADEDRKEILKKEPPKRAALLITSHREKKIYSVS
jgi:hypothetical protein